LYQAKDDIQEYKVTGVQTCPLPISILASGERMWARSHQERAGRERAREARREDIRSSSERRVGVDESEPTQNARRAGRAGRSIADRKRVVEGSGGRGRRCECEHHSD